MDILSDPLCTPVLSRFNKWSSFMTGNVDFIDEADAGHLRAHSRRVLLIGLVLGDKLGFAADSLDALATVAIFHDTRKKSQTEGAERAKRAADYYKAFCRSGKLKFDDRVYEAIAMHASSDDEGFQSCGKLGKECARILFAFKDADDLDTMLLASSNNVDVSRLRTDAAKQLVPFAQRVFRLSRS